jgi:hypothetical protein
MMLARSDDADGLAGYLAENSRLPRPRGNLELAAAFANVMSNSAERSGWYPVLIGWAATPADVVPTNDPREFLPFCALFALGAEFSGADEQARSEIAALLRAAAGNGRWRTREAVAMGMQRIGESDAPALRTLVEPWMEDATLLEHYSVSLFGLNSAVVEDSAVSWKGLRAPRSAVPNRSASSGRPEWRQMAFA